MEPRLNRKSQNFQTNTGSTKHRYILNAVRCPYVRPYVTLGVASSVANNVIMRMDVIMRTGAASAVGAIRANDVIMRMTSQLTIAALWR